MTFKDGIAKEDKKITSFLIAGQSNMAGRGNLNEIPPFENELCFMLRMGRWQPMSEPVNADRAGSGVGLASRFAVEFAELYKKEVGIIPCADGGTAISQWQPGEVLFDHAVMMTRLAMRSSSLGGILWHQGENDACNSNPPDEYERMLINTLTSLRRELGAEDLPIIMGELSYNMNLTYHQWATEDVIKKYNDIIYKVSEILPCCAVVSAKGLAVKPEDGIHFTSASFQEFGKRYFEKYKELTK